jgi:hypothetical protein
MRVADTAPIAGPSRPRQRKASTNRSWAGYQTPHTEQLHVVERYRIIEGGKAIEAVAHVEDPGAFTMPWTPTLSPRRAKEVCAENNADFFDYKVQPIPTATTPDF